MFAQPLSSEQFKQLREHLTDFYWMHDAQQFCEVAGINLDHTYGSEKWMAFATCINAMQAIPDEVWDALLAHMQRIEDAAISGGSRP